MYTFEIRCLLPSLTNAWHCFTLQGLVINFTSNLDSCAIQSDVAQIESDVAQKIPVQNLTSLQKLCVLHIFRQNHMVYAVRDYIEGGVIFRYV